MYKFDYILFDLDGTLTDPFEGITKSVQYALRHMGIEAESLEELSACIGPPLKDSFMGFYGMSESESKQAVDYFREYFTEKGIFENKEYPGIRQMLSELRDRGVVLAVASSKPELFVRQILDHFDLKEYFQVIVGSNMDETRAKKEEVLEEALKQCALMKNEILSKENAAMVGDRKFDVESANQFGVTSVAVSYGYAPEGELEMCDCDYVASTVEELRQLFVTTHRT